VLGGASLAFLAFIGFDIVATMAEETREPGRALPRGILGSLVLVTVLDVAVAASIAGMVAFTELGGPARSGSPRASWSPPSRRCCRSAT
jgi:APA family basic amino acid/polyamine antiporter